MSIVYSSDLHFSYFPFCHCVYEVTELERLDGVGKVSTVEGLSVADERRGNLLSLHKGQEIFKAFVKTTLPRTQCREITSRMQQIQLSLFFVQHIRRLAMTNEKGAA